MTGEDAAANARGRLRFVKMFPLPDPDVVEGFNGIPASNVADVMERTSTLHPRIRLMSSPSAPSVAGVALTVKTRAGDNLVIHQAPDMIAPGYVTRAEFRGFMAKRVLGGPVRYAEAFVRLMPTVGKTF